MANTYEMIFKESPRKAVSLLEKGDHPEVDERALLPTEQVCTYLSLIGQLQWLVSLWRFDIFSAVVMVSQFHAAPRRAHLERLQKMYGYIIHIKQDAIRVRTDPIQGKTFMVGNNKLVVINSIIPHSQLNKRHNALCYHRV